MRQQHVNTEIDYISAENVKTLLQVQEIHFFNIYNRFDKCMTNACKALGISRATGYRILKRIQARG